MAGVQRLALVGSERCRDFDRCGILRRAAGFELRVTAFADAESRRRSLYDPELTFFHDHSFPHRRKPRHHHD